MKRFSAPGFRFVIPLPILLLLILVPQVRADSPTTQPAAPDKYMRFVDRGPSGGELDTADVAFTNPDGVSVHLVAAVHIAEQSYYDTLNKDFQGYDAVLYEMVKPKDSPAPSRDEPSTSGVSEFQRFLKNVLDLQFQLDAIDYTAPNFIHADMDKETFEKMEADRGESFATLMLKQMMDAWQHPPADAQGADEDPDAQMHELISDITRPDGERQFKLIIAKQLDSMDATAMGLDGPAGTVIVTERNKTAISVLQSTIASGKKNIAIFYGAAHMTDMAKRLEDMGFTPTSTQWRLAWDLTIRPDQPSVVEKVLDNVVDFFNSDSGN